MMRVVITLSGPAYIDTHELELGTQVWRVHLSRLEGTDRSVCLSEVKGKNVGHLDCA